MIKIPMVAISLLEKLQNQMRWYANQSVWTSLYTITRARIQFLLDRMFDSPLTIQIYKMILVSFGMAHRGIGQKALDQRINFKGLKKHSFSKVKSGKPILGKQRIRPHRLRWLQILQKQPPGRPQHGQA